jgi:hypothetical protein
MGMRMRASFFAYPGALGIAVESLRWDKLGGPQVVLVADFGAHARGV